MGNTSSSSLPDSSHHVHIANDFKVLQCLGEGGFGIVVKCLKQDTGEIVALKVPVPDEDLRREVNHTVDFELLCRHFQYG